MRRTNFKLYQNWFLQFIEQASRQGRQAIQVTNTKITPLHTVSTRNRSKRQDAPTYMCRQKDAESYGAIHSPVCYLSLLQSSRVCLDSDTMRSVEERHQHRVHEQARWHHGEQTIAPRQLATHDARLQAACRHLRRAWSIQLAALPVVLSGWVAARGLWIMGEWMRFFWGGGFFLEK